MSFLQHLRALDSALAKKHFPPISPAWWDWLEDVYRSPMRRQIVIRAGRRAGKSSTILRLAVCEVLAGDWIIPPGDSAIVAVLSAVREQAKDRLSTIEAILRALDFKKCRGDPTDYESYSMTANEIHILVEREGRAVPVIFRVTTASVSSVGFTALFILADEVTRWEDSEGNNPTKAVLASLRPSLATIPRARVWVVSSAWSTLDEHYRLVELGSNQHQMVFGREGGESWIMNPSLAEADTRELEPDEIAWWREYANRPMKSDPVLYFDGALLDAATVAQPVALERVAAGGDFGFSNNSSALAIATGDGVRVSVVDVREWSPSAGAPLRPSAVCSAAAIVAARWGATSVATDSHYQETASEAFDAHGIERAPISWEKIEACRTLRVLLTGGLFSIVSNDRAINQLKRVRTEPAPSGKWRVIMPTDTEAGGVQSHGDIADAVLAAVYWLTLQGGDEVIRGRPHAIDRGDVDPMTGEESEELDEMPESRWAY